MTAAPPFPPAQSLPAPPAIAGTTPAPPAPEGQSERQPRKHWQPNLETPQERFVRRLKERGLRPVVVDVFVFVGALASWAHYVNGAGVGAIAVWALVWAGLWTLWALRRGSITAGVFAVFVLLFIVAGPRTDIGFSMQRDCFDTAAQNALAAHPPGESVMSHGPGTCGLMGYDLQTSRLSQVNLFATDDGPVRVYFDGAGETPFNFTVSGHGMVYAPDDAAGWCPTTLGGRTCESNSVGDGWHYVRYVDNPDEFSITVDLPADADDNDVREALGNALGESTGMPESMEQAVDVLNQMADDQEAAEAAAAPPVEPNDDAPAEGAEDPAAAAQDRSEAAVRSVFEQYRTALLERDATSASAVVSDSTFDYYDRILIAGLAADADDLITGMPISDGLGVIAMRANLGTELLTVGNGSELFEIGVAQGLVGDNVATTQLQQVDISGDEAFGIVQGQRVLRFEYSDGAWRVDLPFTTSLVDQNEAGIMAALTGATNRVDFFEAISLSYGVTWAELSQPIG